MSDKKQKELKAIIFGNIMVLCLSFVMLAAMTFAWFTAAFSENVEQVMHVGIFKINLTEEIPSGQTSPLLISTDAAYPMTFETAAKEAEAGEKVVYAFEAENTGTVTAQIRLNIQVKSDSGYGAPEGSLIRPLSEQIGFATKIFFDPLDEPLTAWNAYDADGEGGNEPTGGLLFTPNDSNIISFKQYFNSIFLNKVTEAGIDNYYATETGTLYPKALTLDNETGGEEPTEVIKHSKIYVKLLVWLNKDATLESTGAQTIAGGSAPKLEFKIFMSARQKGGGASFTAEEVADLDSEKTPKPDVETAKSAKSSKSSQNSQVIKIASSRKYWWAIKHENF